MEAFSFRKSWQAWAVQWLTLKPYYFHDLLSSHPLALFQSSTDFLLPHGQMEAIPPATPISKHPAAPALPACQQTPPFSFSTLPACHHPANSANPSWGSRRPPSSTQRRPPLALTMPGRSAYLGSAIARCSDGLSPPRPGEEKKIQVPRERARWRRRETKDALFGPAIASGSCSLLGS